MSAGALVWEGTPPSRRIRPRMAPASAGEMKRPGEPIGEDEGAATAAESIPAGAAADPDVALMLRLQAGDQAAFQDLFQKFSPRVVQYARRLVGSEARAEEVTQDVFVQVFRFRQRYRPESRFSTWLFTIATNLCLNEIRRPERRLRVDLWQRRGEDEDRREGPQLPDPAAATPEEGASSRELARQQEAAVEELPPKQRAALLLSRVDGLPYRYVAEAPCCTDDAATALLLRATQSFRSTS